MTAFSEKSKLRLVLMLQVLFFVFWGGWLIRQTNQGEQLWLETVPVDPRDYLRGHYVSLRFVVQQPQTEDCKKILHKDRHDVVGKEIWVQLNSGKPFSLKEGGGGVYSEVAACQMEKPVMHNTQPWVRGKIAAPVWEGERQIGFGIDRFYVSEVSPLRTAVGGQVAARVRLMRNNRFRLLDLVYLARS